MGKKVGSCGDLLAINILALLLIIIIALFPSNILRIILGLPFVLFFPGYALIAALYPQKGDPGGIERVALVFGVSIAVTILTGLVLYYTPWGISLYSILISLAVFILVAAAIGYLRRRRLPVENRFSVSFKITLPRWAGLSNIDKALSIVLFLSVAAAIGVLVYVVAAPKAGEHFTEFYVLSVEGEAVNSITGLVVEQEATVTVGIVNHEGEETSYHIEMTLDGVKYSEVAPFVLADEDKWEETMSFIPHMTGDDQKIELFLYKDEGCEPYRTLYLFIDVGE